MWLQKGTTALMAAATNDHDDCVRVLLAAGAEKDFRNLVRPLILVLTNTYIQLRVEELHMPEDPSHLHLNSHSRPSVWPELY